MRRLSNKMYIEDLNAVAGLKLDWSRFKGKTVMISGATGMIGSFLTDVLMHKNKTEELDCCIHALSRNREKLCDVFREYTNDKNFKYSILDVNARNFAPDADRADYILHLASSTHPKAYASDPIGTITANIIGAYNLLEYAVSQKSERFIFASSVEVYGENRGDTDKFREDYCGYIDSNTLRAGYPESKRVGEALCQAYIMQKGMDIVIPRLARTYGPTMLADDTKAISQFIKRGVNKENIVLKSEGNQLYSYAYVADAVSGILYCLINGKSGEAYNIADERSDITLKALADKIAVFAGTSVVFDLPDKQEALGYSKATKAILDSKKIGGIGWQPLFDLDSGVKRTIEIMRQAAGQNASGRSI